MLTIKRHGIRANGKDKMAFSWQSSTFFEVNSPGLRRIKAPFAETIY